MAKRGNGSIYKRSDGRWAAATTVTTASGLRKRVHHYAASQAAVQEWLTAKRHDEQRGLPTPDFRETVASYLTYWLETVAPVKARPRTLELYELTVRLYINPHLGRNDLTTLSVKDVQEAVNAVLEAGGSPRTAKLIRQVLSSALTHAEREQLVARNVARLIVLPHYERKEITPWTVDEASAFLEAVSGHMWEVGFEMLIYYGMRRGEVLGLRWSDIDFDSGVIHVNQQLQRIDGTLTTGPVKTTAGRRVLPLVAPVRSTLEHLAAARGLALVGNESAPDAEALVMLSSAGTPVEPGNFARAFQEITAKAGLPRITVHHTRHTAATLLKRVGVDPRDAQAILGHANVTTTQQIYQHADPDLHRAALDGIARAIADAGAQTRAQNVSNQQPADANCCQELLSNPSQTALAQYPQGKMPNENRRPTGVETADFDGGSGGDRTRDILLKSRKLHGADALTTPVVRDAERRCMSMIFGLTAVSCAVKRHGFTTALQPYIQSLHSWRQLRRASELDTMRRRSFPYNLLPAAPNITEEATP